MSRPVIVQRYGEFLRKNLHLGADEADVAAYGLELILSIVLPFLAVILAGWLLGCLPLVLAASLTAAFLKHFAGGYHSASLALCCLMGAVVGGGFGEVASIYGPLLSRNQISLSVFAALVLTLGLTWKFAPVETKSRRIPDPALRKKVRRYSLCAAVLAGAAALLIAGAPVRAGNSYALAIGQALLWQSFIMTPAAKIFFRLIDSVFLKSPGEGGELK